MEQITQKPKSYELVIKELPWPQVEVETVLVRNHCWLFSEDTEGSTVKITTKNPICVRRRF